MNLSAIPVVYYHSIKHKKKSNWVHPHIILTLNEFNRHINLFRFLNVHSYFVDDLYRHCKGETKLPNNSLLIQFDDGYLDNFTFAYPLLKKHKLKATIWVNPEFVDDNDDRIRPTLEDYWNNKISLDELNEFDGFLNWAEMREMEKSGIIEIQSHTLTHTQYPISDKIIDFVNPETKIDWLYWNLFPDDKPNFFNKHKYEIPLGHPIYESERANIAIKYEENGNLTNEIINYVQKNGGKEFFTLNDWKEKLFDLTNELKKTIKVDYKKESRDEYLKRLEYELSESKSRIEKMLNKKVDHLCWPFGGRNETTLQLAEKSGYLTSTVKEGRNVFNKKLYRRIDRTALDNPKYQNFLFYIYAIYKLYSYKVKS
jgi:peptidoglycan/xylan/chitin deacetylase (PgdA/CDA1 family)